LFDRLRIKRLEVHKLLTGMRERYPELESYLDPQRVASWEGDGASEGNPGGFGPSAVRWGLLAVLIGAALVRVFANIMGPDTAPTDSPPVAEAAAALQDAEIDLAVADIFGPGIGMAEVRAADPVFADQLRLTFEYTEIKSPLAFVRLKAIGSAEVADYDNLAVRADLRGMWMAAAQQQSDDVCRQVMAGGLRDLDLKLDSKQREREQALLRQLLEAKLLSHISKIYTEEEYKVRSSNAGAGIGLATVFRSGGSFLFVSENQVRTEVTVFFRRMDSFREFKDQFRFISTQFYF
jgi:hypothetical protein